MPLYAYEAFSRDGKKVRGVLDGPSVVAVKQQLSKQGLFPTSVALAQDEMRYGFLRRLFMRNVSIKQKILFTKQFAVLLRSGVPLLQSIDLLIEQFEGRMRTILVSIRDEIREGSSLANAMQRFPKVFDVIYVQLVRAGEASGNLEPILERLTHFLERQQEIRQKIKSALRMPIIQLVAAVLVVVAIMIFVVPKMMSQFASRGQELPLQTRILIGMSNFFVNHYLLLLIGLIIITSLFLYWKRTATGKLIIDKIKLRLPVVKYLTKTNAVVQFSYTLGMLLEGGVHLSEALDIVVKIVDNQIIAKTLNEARENIIKQGKIAQYLRQTGIFPAIATYLIQTGEESGQLDKMLLTVAENYEKEVGDLTDRLTGLLNPIMIVFMGVIVGFIVMALLPVIMPQEGF